MTHNPPRQHYAGELAEAEQAEAAGLPLAEIVRPTEWHQARLGRRRTFRSAADAAAYDAGYASWPHDDGFAINTPFSTGYWDAEKQAVMAL